MTAFPLMRVDDRIEELERQMALSEAYLASQTFQPTKEEFKRHEELRTELYRVYEMREQGRDYL